MNQKEELEDFIASSALSDDDKKSWKDLISNSAENFVESLAEVLKQFPDELSWFNDIYKRKKAAFTMLDSNKAEGQAKLKEIYAEEKNKLEKLLNS